MPDQLKFSDIVQKSARAARWYDSIWKTVNKCVFCDLKDRYVIKELDDVVLTTNLYPYIDGHLMIIPKRHITHLKQLTTKEWDTIRALAYLSKKMLRKVLEIRGLWMIYREGNLGSESQKTVEHLHIHMLPYKEGLVEWNYDEVRYSPADIAHYFRKMDKQMDEMIKRYKSKYSK